MQAVASESYARMPNDPRARFTPVLTDLVQAGLLERDDRGRWVLAEMAQGWLEARVTRPGAPSQARVAVGLRCQSCGASGLTTLADGQRLCSACKVSDGYVDADPLPQLRPRHTS